MRARLARMCVARLFEADFSEDVGVFLAAYLDEVAVEADVTVRATRSR